MTATYGDLPIKAVKVTAQIEFTAYVIDYQGKETDTWSGTLADQLRNEITDAIEYHAPHLGDSACGDGIVALIDGGSGRAVIGTVTDISDLAPKHTFTSADVDKAVKRTQAWL